MINISFVECVAVFFGSFYVVIRIIVKNRFEEDLVDFFAFFGLLIYSFLHTLSGIAEVTDFFEAYHFGSIATFMGILFWLVSVLWVRRLKYKLT